MNKKTLLLTTLIFLIQAHNAKAQEPTLPEILITADQQATSYQNTAAAFTVIRKKEIERKNVQNITELLRGLPGVQITSLGSTGDDADIRIRGADRDEVLVLIDGIRLNTVSENRALYLNSIPVEMINRIEIIRGSQSIMYGSDAVGGVIHIFTQKPPSSSKAKLNFAAGNLGTFRESVWFGSGNEVIQSSAFISREDQKGRFSNDASQNTLGQFKISYKPNSHLQFEMGSLSFNHHQDLFYEFLNTFDPSLGAIVVRINPDLNRNLSRTGWLSYFNTSVQINPRWKLEENYNINFLHTTLSNSSTGENVPSGFNGTSQDYHGQEWRQTASLKNFIQWKEGKNFNTQSTLGFEFAQEKFQYQDLPITFPIGDQKSTRENYAPFFQQKFSFFEDRIQVNGGVRYDHNTSFGHKFSPRASLLFNVFETQTSFQFNYAQGFHAPTLLDFYTSTLQKNLGLPYLPVKLQAELSQSYDFGVRQKFGKYGELDFAFFKIDYNKLLDGLQFLPTAETSGLETKIKIKPFQTLEIGGAYTFTHSENKLTSLSLSDRPTHQGSIYLNVKPWRNLNICLDVLLVGSRLIPNILSTASADLPIIFEDQSGNPSGGSRVNSLTESGRKLPPYQRLDLSLDYQWKKPFMKLENLKFYSKLYNLLNQNYQEKFGIPSSRFSFLVGFEANL